MNRAPVILFTYNRLEVLSKTIESLRNNLLIEETDLFIFSDGPKQDNYEDKIKVDKVRNYLKSLTQFTKTFNYYEQESNLGLARSVTQGISSISEQNKNFIVLEDDLITSKYFLKYMNHSLEKFQDNPKVWNINGMGINKFKINIPESYEYSTYFTFRPSSHGWGSWSDRWQKGEWNNEKIKKEIFNIQTLLKFNRGGRDLIEMLIQQLNGRVDSWAINWCYTISKNNGICISPVNSYVSAQPDVDGTHIKGYVEILDNDLSKSLKINTYPESEKINYEIAKNLSLIYSTKKPSLLVQNSLTIKQVMEYIVFIKKYCIDKYLLKSKKHKLFGYIKSLMRRT
tara:strand:- start:1869 stop:2891 length:1023 start_codon:yes stop_codon:yes gene_type:complete